jgi:hypothetical protein
MKNPVFTILFVTAFAVSSLCLKPFADFVCAAAPVANAGSNITVLVGEAIRLDGSASTGYVRESQADGTWSIRWQTGDGMMPKISSRFRMFTPLRVYIRQR